jgi:hypothetical protein
MAEQVRRFQLGLSVESGNVNRCYEALRALLNGSTDLRPDFEGFRDLHSEKRLRSAFKTILSCKRGY